jgi:hypothetical protein
MAETTESPFSIFMLANSDINFRGPSKELEALVGTGFYSTNGINDLGILANCDVPTLLTSVANLPGIMSSRTLFLKNQVIAGKNPSGKRFGFLLLDSLYGKNTQVQNSLDSLEEVYASYNCKGIYDTLGLVCFDDEQAFKQRINSIPGVRNAALLRTGRKIKPIQVTNPAMKLSLRSKLRKRRKC